MASGKEEGENESKSNFDELTRKIFDDAKLISNQLLVLKTNGDNYNDDEGVFLRRKLELTQRFVDLSEIFDVSSWSDKEVQSFLIVGTKVFNEFSELYRKKSTDLLKTREENRIKISSVLVKATMGNDSMIVHLIGNFLFVFFFLSLTAVILRLIVQDSMQLIKINNAALAEKLSRDSVRDNFDDGEFEKIYRLLNHEKPRNLGNYQSKLLAVDEFNKFVEYLYSLWKSSGPKP